MARQVDTAARSLRHAVLLRQRWSSRVHTHRLSSSLSSDYSSSAPTIRSNIDHHSLVTSVPNLQALQRVQWILQQPQRRVLLLSGSSAYGSATRAALERRSPAFELERLGHGVFGVREFCQFLLRESGQERRVFGRAQLMALLLHEGFGSPGASKLAATSTLQRRKGAQDLLQLFRLLESEGATSEQYKTVTTASGEPIQMELADKYAAYHEMLVQHDATSWDGLVMDVLTKCEAQDATSKLFSESIMQEYTDVVLDDVQRMTPAMARLVGYLCGQPSVQSSASFSRVLLEGDECPRTQNLEQRLKKTAASTGRIPNVTRVDLIDINEKVDERAKMQAFAQRILTQSGSSSDDLTPPVPFKCWRFGVLESEEKRIGEYLAEYMNHEGVTQATVVCPSYADAHRIAMAFKKQRLPVHTEDGRFAVASSSSGTPIHLFDEPGVNALYSLLCALCFPSDSRHLYNVLRSDFFNFPAELLSWLMEKEHQSHAELFEVIETFIESRGKSLGTSLRQKENESYKLPQAVACQLETGLERAELFVEIIQNLRAKCHNVSTTEIVQSFLEQTGTLESLLRPNSPDQERKSLVLSDFLRELSTAQDIVRNAQVTFVVPYLQQLRETKLTSSVSWEEFSPEFVGTASKISERSIRVLPLTAYSLESLAASVNQKEDHDKHLLVLMSMRDSKFPGRMKRLTLPLPYDLLSEPFPIQTRTEHLDDCEKLAYEALTLGVYDEVILSYAEVTATLSSKREVLSRIFQPIWHEGDQPPVSSRGKGGSKSRSGKNKLSSAAETTSHTELSSKSTATQDTAISSPKTPRFWLLEMADVMRSFISQLFVPILHHEKDSFSVDIPTKTKTSADDIQASRDQAKRILYDPSHLSYSQISEYLRCPHRYYLSRVMKLNGDVSTAMMFGSALHEGVAAFAKSLAATQQNGDVTKEAKTLAAVEGEEAFMRAWTGDGYGLFSSKEQASFLLERGMTSLWDFIETHHRDLELQEILHVEQKFSFHVPKANVEFRGVWDRIDRVSKVLDDGSSSLVIKEFKSNMGGATRNMRKLAEESLQLKMYMYAFRKVFGEAPYGAKLEQIGGNYNDSGSKTRKRISRAGNDNNGFIHFSEEAMQEAEDAIVNVASGLRNGDFEPKPGFAECSFCPFAGSACHFASDEASYERQSARKASAGSVA